MGTKEAEVSMNTHTGHELGLDEINALERLIVVAKGFTLEAEKTASFLLSWWNKKDYGGFHVLNAWGVNQSIAQDMITVFALAMRLRDEPHILGYDGDFIEIANKWPLLQIKLPVDERCLEMEIYPREISGIDIETVLSDPTASCWLKQALKTSLQYDPADVLNDVEFLMMICRHRFSETLNRARQLLETQQRESRRG